MIVTTPSFVIENYKKNDRFNRKPQYDIPRANPAIKKLNGLLTLIR
jgi:hypothetical protein